MITPMTIVTQKDVVFVLNNVKYAVCIIVLYWSVLQGDHILHDT